MDKPYTLMWYKKEGGAVLKALDIERIQSVSLIYSNRPLVYLPSKHSLVLQSEAGNNNKDILLAQPLEHEDNASSKQEWSVFLYFPDCTNRWEGSCASIGEG
jgi:hypothetical protein